MLEDSKEAEKEVITSSQQLIYTRNPSRNEDFLRTIAKIAVAQICENQGLLGFQQSALEALSDVAIRYVKELGKASNLYANLAGRSECNVFDLIQGLEDLGLVQGFTGASDVHRSISRSGVIRDIGQYVNFTENVPFVYDVPRFLVSRECKLPPSFSQSGNDPPGEHIPAWLPVFPGLKNQRDSSFYRNVVDVAKDEQQEQHLAANDRVEANMNPFLAPPMQYGEKEIGLVEPPPRFIVRNHGYMMETFGGMYENEGLSKEVCEIEERNNNTTLVDGKPKVQFKLSNVKKLSPSSTAFVRNKRDQKLARLFRIEEENGEKLSCTEESLKDSLEMKQMDSQ